MSQNPNFPNWITANTILPMLVEKYCEVFIEGEYSDINIGFLNADAIYLVPPEDREKFDQIYSEFAAFIHKELDMPNMLEKFIGEPNSPICKAAIKHTINNALLAWEQRCGWSLKNLLLFKLLHSFPDEAAEHGGFPRLTLKIEPRIML